MEKVRPRCGQPSDRGRLRNRTKLVFHGVSYILTDDPAVEAVLLVVDVDGGAIERRRCGRRRLGPDRMTAAVELEGRVQLIVTVNDRLTSAGHVERHALLFCCNTINQFKIHKAQLIRD